MAGSRYRPAIPTLKKNGVNYTTNKKKAELLGKYFSGVSSNSGHSVEFQERKSDFEDELLKSFTEGNCLLTTSLLMIRLLPMLYVLLCLDVRKTQARGRIPSPPRS